jgi:5-methylcytosine-specific restriction endonuclease McrA
LTIIDRDGVPSKSCIHCAEWKPLSDYSPRNLYGVPKGDGHQSYCKKCYRTRFRAWREKNMERQRAYERAYREKHREKLREYDRNHYLANRELHNALIRKAYHKNPGKKLARIRAYMKANPDKAAAKSNRRRAREHAAPGSHTIAEWLALKEQYHNTCLCCGRSEPEIELTRDHVVALDAGGSDNIINLQPLCRACNSAKGTQTIDYRPRLLRERRPAYRILSSSRLLTSDF